MEQDRPFVVLRYFLIEEAQQSFNAEPLPAIKGMAILDALMPEREWRRNGVFYSFVGFSAISPNITNTFPPNRFYAGKIAKLRKAHVGEKIPGDIVEHEKDDWIPLTTIIDSQTQTILVQKDWRFGTTDQICAALESGLRGPVLAVYNHRVFVESKPIRGKFWEVINTHSKLYKLELRLISPNILQTNVKARNAILALKELFGQDEFQLKMKNDSGSLEVPENPTSDYIEYIEEGEGSWRVTTEGLRGGKRVHSSEDSAETLDLGAASYETNEIKSLRSLASEEYEPALNRAERQKSMVEKAFRHITGRSGS
ncbi:hypothetical protein [Thiobaca trueperi]|uniref:Uncharacterized protein n=1 Tax=Thiobaca trueperi TaxID=127458 RepID=A0A4R3N6A8_9GAMM|nr:hypothetical protein [Thiobaca trueperi]TCT24304.1 hypothetical protein EDC35_101626 [Thiobaca trueperi]